MKKHIFFTAVFALFALFFTTAANAQGRGHGYGRGNKHYYKEQRRMDRAYAHGYRQGHRDDYRYERRHGRVAYCPPPVYRPRHRRYYRQAPVVYMPPAPRPYYGGGGVSIHIPLPPLPPHP